jgi:hypothetical protein
MPESIPIYPVLLSVLPFPDRTSTNPAAISLPKHATTGKEVWVAVSVRSALLQPLHLAEFHAA